MHWTPHYLRGAQAVALRRAKYRFSSTANSLIRPQKFPDSQQHIPCYFSRQSRKNEWISPVKSGHLALCAYAHVAVSRFIPCSGKFPQMPVTTKRASVRSLRMLRGIA